jgi:hypothetical protein
MALLHRQSDVAESQPYAGYNWTEVLAAAPEGTGGHYAERRRQPEPLVTQELRRLFKVATHAIPLKAQLTTSCQPVDVDLWVPV